MNRCSPSPLRSLDLEARMPRSRSRFFFVVLLSTALLTACSFGPPPSCGEEIGGTTDSGKFDENFAAMTLISEVTGEEGPQGEGGAEFASGESLAVQIDSKTDVEVRACVQPVSGGKEIAFDQTQSISPGSATFGMGSFDPGRYVIRVIVDGTLVKNFPFTTR